MAVFLLFMNSTLPIKMAWLPRPEEKEKNIYLELLVEAKNVIGHKHDRPLIK